MPLRCAGRGWYAREESTLHLPDKEPGALVELRAPERRPTVTPAPHADFVVAARARFGAAAGAGDPARRPSAAVLRSDALRPEAVPPADRSPQAAARITPSTPRRAAAPTPSPAESSAFDTGRNRRRTGGTSATTAAAAAQAISSMGSTPSRRRRCECRPNRTPLGGRSAPQLGELVLE